MDLQAVGFGVIAILGYMAWNAARYSDQNNLRLSLIIEELKGMREENRELQEEIRDLLQDRSDGL